MSLPQSTEKLLEAAKDAALRYLRERDERPIVPPAEAISALDRLRLPLAETGLPAEKVVGLLSEVGSPAAVGTTGGRYYGFVVGGALPVSVGAQWLATAWDQNAGAWVLSPIAAELEVIAKGWLLELLDLPRDATMGFVTGATTATFSALAAARAAQYKKLGYDLKARGLAGAPPLRIITSEECHPTNIAALGYLGIGRDQVERVKTDRQGRLITAELPALDERCVVITQAGNINSGSFDPFAEVGQKVRAAGAWLHVDGAFGLWARAADSTRYLTEGLEQADSWSVDGHKWLNIPQDSAIYVCRDGEAVHEVFGVDAPYLNRTPRYEPNQTTPELSRRARGVEFWAAIAHLGPQGISDLVERCCRHASRFANGLREAGYDVLNEVVINQVSFALPTEAETMAAMQRIQESGVTWLGPTRWQGRAAMRISVSSWATTDEDVERSLEVMKKAITG